MPNFQRGSAVMKAHSHLGFLAIFLCASIVSLSSCHSSSTRESGGSLQLIGAGSTFVYPMMKSWIANYQQKQPAVSINYQAIGSGGGVQQLKRSLVDFSASDMPLPDDQLQEMPALVQIPGTAGPVCI